MTSTSSSPSKSPGRRLGETLVKKGVIDQAQLFQFLQRQAVEVFHGALLASEGYYIFRLPSESEEPLGTQIHVPIHGLLMEGVQRIDEMALFRERIPSNQMCPVPIPDASVPKKPDEAAQKLLAYCDGERSIDDLARLTGKGEFATTKAVYHLLQDQAGDVAPRDQDRRGHRREAREFVLTRSCRTSSWRWRPTGGVSQTRMTLDALDRGQRLRSLLRERDG